MVGNGSVDKDFAVGGSILYRIGQKIIRYLFHIRRGEPHILSIVFAMYIERDVFLGGTFLKQLGRVFNKIQRVTLLDVKLEIARLHFVESDQLINQPYHLIGVFYG